MGFYFKSFVILLTVVTVTLHSIREGYSQDIAQHQALEKLLDQAVKDKDQVKACAYSYELGKSYRNENQLEKAIFFFSQCLSYGKKNGDVMLLYLATQQLGIVFIERKNYSKAINSFEKAVKFAEKLKKPIFEMEGLIHIAISEDLLGKPKKAIEPLEKALAISQQQNDLLSQQKCYELLSEYYEKTGNADKSNEYKHLNNIIIQSKQNEALSIQQQKTLEQHIKKTNVEKKIADTKLKSQVEKLKHAEDSLLATKSSLEETTQSLQQANETNEKRQLQIDLLNKDKELAELRIHEQNAQLENEALIRNSIIAGIILATALISVMVNGYRKKIKANKQIDEQNKSIKGSINYAKRIQEAMLPKIDLQKKLIPDSFVLFKPRDSVSGDFYFFSEIKSWYNPDVVFAAADCTGHGVPGAFMSLVGINALTGIIGRGIAEPDHILNELNTEIRNALQQETTGNNDGMDVALCIYRKEKNIVEFAGAKNPLLYIQNNKLFKIKGDAASIGGRQRKNNFLFKKHIVKIDVPTTLYLFSDGYRDQFGGQTNSKFMSKKFADLLLEIHLLPLNDQKEILNKTLEEWRGEHPQTDDVLVIGIKLDTITV